MTKVSGQGQAGQVATLPGVAAAGPESGVHPPREAGAPGPEGRGRVAGGPSTHTHTTITSADPAPGLVPSAKTARVSRSSVAGLDGSVVSPTLADVRGAAEAFGSPPWRDLGQESPLPRWYITPGALIGTRTSARQLVRSAEFAQLRRIASANVAAAFMVNGALIGPAIIDPAWRPNPLPGREVTCWSAKSRSNMVKMLATLDWRPVFDLAESGRVPAMVTLTYPGDWEAVAPDGETVKRQVRRLLSRYERIWGEPLVGAWKLEFQHRGAPHLHIFMVPPHGRARARERAAYESALLAWEAAGRRELLRQIALGERWGTARKLAMRAIGPQPRWRSATGDGLAFRHWLSVNWAHIVDHPDPVEYQKHLVAGTGVDFREAHKCSDPKRLAVYFGKHGQYRSKEYQHNVPELWQAPGKGPGRFWGYWGLKPLAVAVELTGENYMLAARIMRRWAARTRVWDKPAGEFRYVRSMAPAKQRWRDVDESTGEVVWRKRRRRSRVDRFRSGSGFLVVNDGPALARQLARAIEVCGVPQ